MSRPTVVLLNGLGSDSSLWDSVVPLLGGELDVVPLDLRGHGGRHLPYGMPPTPAALALWASEDLAARGLGEVHVAGHSLGGWVAFELARLGRVASVTAVSPGGLWKGREPRWTRAVLRAAHAGAVLGGPLIRWAGRTGPGRWLTLRLAVSHPERLTPTQAWSMDAAMTVAEGFDDVLDAMAPLRLDARDVAVPVTVLFGDHDVVLPARVAQVRDGLPAQHRWVEVPDSGHAVLVEEPKVVARAVLDTVAAGERARPVRARAPRPDLSRYGFADLPNSTRDDTAAGWGERPAGPDDEWYLRERPPHWG